MTTPPPEYMSLEEGHAAYRPVGEFTFEKTVAMIDDALRYCIGNQIRALLVDITGVTGFPPPSTAERFYFATKWAETAGGKVALAMVAPPAIVDPEHIGVLMASNRGLTTDVFTETSEALTWLRRAKPEPVVI